MSRTRISNTVKLRFYKPRKRIGDVITIAEKTGYHETYVSKVLNQKVAVVETIIDTAYKMAYRRKTNRELGIKLGKKRGPKNL
jgi:hypothetical protein